MRLFVTGIGTEIGKTISSSILVEALQADYWKPVQAGELENSDTMRVEELISNGRTILHPERYSFFEPASPHYASALEGVQMKLEDFELPETDNHLIVEGAGGLLVPLNDKHLMIDLMAHLKLPVVLVSRHYLGSINHTLLSLEALQNRGIEVLGIIFNGDEHPPTEEAILQHSNATVLGRIHDEEGWYAEKVLRYAEQFKSALVPIM